MEAADEDYEHTHARYPNRMVRIEALQQGSWTESNPEQIGSAELWMQSAVSSLTADYHLSGTVSKELEERRRYQFLLTNHMFGGRH
jgi:hypothetical protein